MSMIMRIEVDQRCPLFSEFKCHLGGAARRFVNDSDVEHTPVCGSDTATIFNIVSPKNKGSPKEQKENCRQTMKQLCIWENRSLCLTSKSSTFSCPVSLDMGTLDLTRATILKPQSQLVQFEDFSCARDLACVVISGTGGGVALCAASRKHFLCLTAGGELMQCNSRIEQNRDYWPVVKCSTRPSITLHGNVRPDASNNSETAIAAGTVTEVPFLQLAGGTIER
ncbi:hypothetical protein J6590_057610 [Homalodisca vitripennis]|nr:hypothetical protein J6590_057610 [Homalodisca vitripennis]